MLLKVHASTKATLSQLCLSLRKKIARGNLSAEFKPGLIRHIL